MNKKITSYLEQVLSKLKGNLFVMILSIMVYLLYYMCGVENFVLSFSYLKLSLGHIGYIGLLFIPAFLVIEKDILQKLWIFFSGLVLLDLQNLIYITNGKIEIIPTSFYSSIFLTIIICLFLITVFFGISKSITTIDFKIKFKNLLLVLYSSIFFIMVYHISNIWLVSKGVENRDRSLFIHGLEIHHINYGVILLIFVPFLFKYISRLSKKLQILGYSFIGFIYGTVFDECFYYMNEYKSEKQYDELYLNDIPIILISLIIMTISFFIWFFILKKQKDFNDI